MLAEPSGVAATFRPTTPLSAVGVVIPAHDEAARIRAALAAVIASCRPVTATCMIVVVDDGSTDDTARIAGQALREHDGPWAIVSDAVGCVGAARRVGADVILRQGYPADSTWLLSTDADSIVPVDWVERFANHHALGAVAVAGVVHLIDDDDAHPIHDRWAADYLPTIDAAGGHPHVHAANLGIRLDAYERVGGFRDIVRIEDIDLWDRLRASGIRPVADARIAVATSARRDGRVERGFAHALRRLYH